MSSIPAMPSGDQWKDLRYVQEWKQARRAHLKELWGERVTVHPGVTVSTWLRDHPFVNSPEIEARELIQFENESLVQRAYRLEGQQKKSAKKNKGASHQVPMMLAKDGERWIVHPALSHATPDKLEKAKRMWDLGLEKKAQREIACGVLGGEVKCKNGHAFMAAYECGNRYCRKCGPKGARTLFARHVKKLLFVSTRLLLCGQDECKECHEAIENQRLPHWPPVRGKKPRIVCAKLDFTLRHDGSTPYASIMRGLNMNIKKFCRALEKRFGISRKEYGIAYCDELGGSNSNPHAHAIYVGPWLPQKKKELSLLWREITGDSFIISIKYAEDFARALHHAVKYPAKFAERSAPERLADLEKVFHRVRRFHTLAAFYAPEAPVEEKPPSRRCPDCGESLSMVFRWQTIAALVLRGLKDLETATVAASRNAGLEGRGPP
jgi:hypothetical protein